MLITHGDVVREWRMTMKFASDLIRAILLPARRARRSPAIVSLPSPSRFEKFRRSWGGGWRKQYLGALVIILLALNAPGNLLRFTSVVENNSFPLSPKTIYGAGRLAGWLGCFLPPEKRQKNARYHLIVFIYDYYCDWDARRRLP